MIEKIINKNNLFKPNSNYGQPKTSDAVTALSKYIIALIIISAVGITESVIVERIMEIRQYPPSRFLERIVADLPPFHTDKLSEAQQMADDSDDSEDDDESRNSKEASPAFAISYTAMINNRKPKSEKTTANFPSQSALRRRRRSRFYTRNNCQWRQIAYRIDTASFITCLFLAIVVPMALFLPLILVSENCADSAKDFLFN